MANLKLRYLTIVILLVLAGTVVYGLQYDSSYDDRAGLADLQSFPMQVGKWTGRDFSLDEMVYEILETRAILHRSYSADNGDDVFLSVVHYHDTKVDFHAPEACIGCRGNKTGKTTKRIMLTSVNKKKRLEIASMITTRDTGQTLTYYFFKAGPFMGSNYIKMRWNIAVNKLARNDARASLIRISTVLLPGKEVESEKRLKDFLEEFLPHFRLLL
jgi:EpsI family protein